MGRPKTGETGRRSIRVPDGRWDAAKAKAEREGKSVTDVVNECLEKYVQKPDKQS